MEGLRINRNKASGFHLRSAVWAVYDDACGTVTTSALHFLSRERILCLAALLKCMVPSHRGEPCLLRAPWDQSAYFLI
jgi:hypothetical protein